MVLAASMAMETTGDVTDGRDLWTYLFVERYRWGCPELNGGIRLQNHTVR